MDLGIQGKKALVTGASRGIGRAIASSLAQEGVRVAIVARGKNEVLSFVEEHGNEHVGLIYDLMEPESPSWMLDELKDKIGSPDIVVHNLGGTLNITDPFCSINEWRRILVTSHFLASPL